MLMRWFASWGVPQQLRTDNGPPFSSSGFASFCRAFHIKHTTSSPYYPRSNGHAEASGVREAKKVVAAHKIDSIEFCKAIINRRNTRLPTRGAAPARIVLGRLVRGGDIPLPDEDRAKVRSSAKALEPLEL